MNNVAMLGAIDFSAWTGENGQLLLTNFESVIESVLPIIGVAVLVGFLFYTIRYAIGLFRGI